MNEEEGDDGSQYSGAELLNQLLDSEEDDGASCSLAPKEAVPRKRKRKLPAVGAPALGVPAGGVPGAPAVGVPAGGVPALGAPAGGARKKAKKSSSKKVCAALRKVSDLPSLSCILRAHESTQSIPYIVPPLINLPHSSVCVCT
jgi:hypothetical protein